MSNFMEIRTVGGRADTRGQTKLISAFHDYVNVLKKSWLKKKNISLKVSTVSDSLN